MKTMTQEVELLQNPIKKVQTFGQSIWLDGLVSREAFESLIRQDGVRGATTNPTIFEKAISAGADSEWRHFIETHTEEEIFKKIAVRSVQELADLFRGVYHETRAADGFVSIEVNPLLAYDTERTVAEARELFGLVNRPNVMVKVPATKEGIPAVESLIADGINVNVTLIFSQERHREVMNAYLTGLERRAAANKPVASIGSVASFFVSRVDTAADKRIRDAVSRAGETAGAETLKGLLGRTAIANSKLVYAEYEKLFSSARFGPLKALGAHVQRPLWASTGTKNPEYSDVLYVDSLIGPDTVNTLPPATLDAFRDHGTAEPTLKQHVDEARRTLEALGAAGISLAAITRELELDGVRLFSDSYKKIISFIRSKKQ